MRAKENLTLNFQSCINNIHLYLKNWNKRTSFSAPNIRFQQALGQKLVHAEKQSKGIVVCYQFSAFSKHKKLRTWTCLNWSLQKSEMIDAPEHSHTSEIIKTI